MNIHFQQYITNFPEYKRAYITNYEIDIETQKQYENEYNFLTWKTIFDEVSKENRYKKKTLITGYLKYLKNVCYIMEIKDMRFNNLSNLAQFHAFVTELIETTNIEYFSLSPYDTKYNYSATWSGSYFSLKKISTGKTIYPCFGVNYADTATQIRSNFLLDFFIEW